MTYAFTGSSVECEYFQQDCVLLWHLCVVSKRYSKDNGRELTYRNLSSKIVLEGYAAGYMSLQSVGLPGVCEVRNCDRLVDVD